MEDLEGIKSRLDNIEGVAPILMALRNIAAGTWRLARTRLEGARAFTEELGNIARALQPLLAKSQAKSRSVEEPKAHPNVAILAIASERGLCGAFNSVLSVAAENYIDEERAKGSQVQVMTLGARITRHFQKEGVPLILSESLPVTTVPALSLVQRLYRSMNEFYDSGQIDLVYAVHTPYHPYAAAKPILKQVLPIALTVPESELETATWIDPIVDVDPSLIYERVQRQWGLVNLYRIIMESAASEQAARYRVLDGASNNCTRLIDELTLAYHTARQHAITMEMLDLVGGAGLLKSPESREG